jgi:hypothetical protein
LVVRPLLEKCIVLPDRRIIRAPSPNGTMRLQGRAD